MYLRKIRVQNYRSIVDSGWVPIDGVTCLVGKNESGKSASLKAIEGLNSTDTAFVNYNKIEDYPRRYLAQYDERHAEQEAEVISSQWELTEADIAEVSKVLGKSVFKDKFVTVTKRYESASKIWSVPLKQKDVLDHLIAREDLSEKDAKCLETISSTQSAAKALEALESRSERQSSLLGTIKSFKDSSAMMKAIEILQNRMPKFLYFSHYDRMSGEISVNKLNADKATPTGISTGDSVFLDFLSYAGTNLDELTKTNRFEELNAKCEAAANNISDQIFEYWTQNEHLDIDVVLSEGKSQDPAPFNSGLIARARVRNNLHKVSVPFSERSAGFIWFFSFLVKFAQIKKSHGNVVLLLDEPGLTLHGTAQKDLLRYFQEKISPNHQLVYTTHSPFMVPADNLSSVRTVEDVVVTKRGRKQSEGTKVRDDILATDRQTNFPIFGALGFEVTQTLLIGENTLLVEGPSDILYLQVASTTLTKLGRTGLKASWNICPSGGIDKILPFVRLFFGNNLNIAVLTDFDRGQKNKIETLKRSEILELERIILATDIAEKDEADIEDFFEPALFVKLLNQAYNLEGEHELTVNKLNQADEKTDRLVKKAEAFFRVLPPSVPEFNHYAPSYYLQQHPEILSGKSAGVRKTLDRFEKVFEKINDFTI
ncbi:MAG: AAA family ATPase [Cyanobacteria bacterium P01_D01_bin.36]